jgi:hypothetical protein
LDDDYQFQPVSKTAVAAGENSKTNNLLNKSSPGGSDGKPRPPKAESTPDCYLGLAATEFVPDKFDTIKRRRQKPQGLPPALPAADLEIRECFVKIYRDPQLLCYVPVSSSTKKRRVKEAFILKAKHNSPAASGRSSPDRILAPIPYCGGQRRPSVCSSVDPLQPLFRQVSALPRARLLDFDSLGLSDDFAQLISSPQFEGLVQSFVVLKQKTLEVENFFFFCGH